MPKACRLRRKEDFRRLRRGRRVAGERCRVVWRRNGLNHGRLAVAVARRLGKAVRRNRFRRVVRETFRQHALRHLPADVLVVATRPLDRRQDGLREELARLFDRVAREIGEAP